MFDENNMHFIFKREVSSYELQYDEDRVKQAIITELCYAIEQHLMESNMVIKKEIGIDHTEYRVELYITSPEMFWNIINLKAREIGNFYFERQLERIKK